MSKILKYTRIFYNWRLAKNIELNYLPEDISIELTNSCNFKCSFCPQSDPNHFHRVTRSTLSPDNALILLQKLRNGGITTDVIHWTLDGEPFINQDIDQICKKAIEAGFSKFIFSTNGFYCTPERVASLPTGGGGQNSVSYQFWTDYCADAEMFETHRGSPNSWQRIRDNLTAILLDDRFEHVQINLTDISSYQIDDPDTLQKNLDALKNLFPASHRLFVTSRIFHNATGFVPGILEKKQVKHAQRYNLCPYPWTSLVIASNGDVVACCRDLEHKTVLGNLFEEDLATIWNGERFQAMRRALVDQKPEAVNACAGCDLPYDQGKFTIPHLVQTGIKRLGILQ